MTSTWARSRDDVDVELNDGVLALTLNRPDSLNALTTQLVTDLADLVERAGGDEQVRVITLTGAGRAFSSGADLSGSSDSEERSTSGLLEAANRLVGAIRDVPRPVVAIVGGPAAGVSVSIALAADLTVARESAYFLLAFTRIGLMPDGGASALVAASAGRAKAMRMALLAERLSASEALSSGLISHMWNDDDFDAGLERLLDQLRNGPSGAFARTKHAINAATLGALDDAFERERVGQQELIRSADFAEGTSAFAEKRPPRFTGR